MTAYLRELYLASIVVLIIVISVDTAWMIHHRSNEAREIEQVQHDVRQVELSTAYLCGMLDGAHTKSDIELPQCDKIRQLTIASGKYPENYLRPGEGKKL